MNNEIQRKITSLTLMTIMLAGGMTIAAPSMVPEVYAANEALYVSAENSTYNNTFGGPQILEVVVSNSDINRLDQAYGSPDVTVNGQDVVMAQGSDGSWYAYIADETNVDLADADANFDFGIKCTVAQADDAGVFFNAANTSFAQTEGVYTNASSCVSGHGAATTQNVLEGTKSLNADSDIDVLGQIDLEANVWPFIQLYNFNPTGQVEIEYKKAGGNEVSILTYDTTTDLVVIDVDRNLVPQGAQVHIGIGDPQLNIDPTSEDSWFFDNVDGGAHYGDKASPSVPITATDAALSTMMFESNGILKITTNSVLEIDATNNDTNPGADQIALYETGANTSYFTTYDDSDDSILQVASAALRGTAGTFDYNDSPLSIVTSNFFATVDMDADSVGNEWNSGEAITVTLTDEDLNKNSRADEDLDLHVASNTLIPSLQIGSPFTLETADTFFFSKDLTFEGTSITTANDFNTINDADLVPITSSTFDAFNKRTIVNNNNSVTVNLDSTGTADGTAVQGSAFIVGFTGRDIADLKTAIEYPSSYGGTGTFDGLNYLNYDIRTINNNQSVGSHAVVQTDIFLVVGDVIGTNDIDSTDIVAAKATAYCLVDIAINQPLSGMVPLGDNFHDILYTNDSDASTCNGDLAFDAADPIGIMFFLDDLDTGAIHMGTNAHPIVVDFFSYGDRTNNAIYRMELEESGDNTSEFIGSVEYIMLNQLNVDDSATYSDVVPISDEIVIIVHEDMTDEDALRVNYLDLGADGVSTQIADQQDAPSHSGVVSLDMDSYKVADTVTVTLTDMDLNVDSDLIDVFSTQISGLVDDDTISTTTHLLDITFNDVTYTGLDNDGFVLVETGSATGIFVGNFQVPATYDSDGFAGADTTTPIDNVVTGGTVGGTFILNDATDNTTQTYTVGQVITATEVGVSGNIATHTVVAGDLTNGILNDNVSFTITAVTNSFANADNVTVSETTATATTTGTDIEVNYNDHRNSSGNTIEVGDGASIRANTGSVSFDRSVYPVPFDSDDFSEHSTATGSFDLAAGPAQVHIRVTDADEDVSAIGEDSISASLINVKITRGSLTTANLASTTATILETSPDSGVFEYDLSIASAQVWDDNTAFVVNQGDIITVTYSDPQDASGKAQTVTDSSSFDLRNGTLQADKSVYLIGSDMILTLIEPDFDLNNDDTESYTLDLIEWDSDAATTSMGPRSITGANAAFDPEPSTLRETGDSTGIFQVVIEIPDTLDSELLDRGEKIDLEYTDWGPAGADYVGQEDEDIGLTVYTSNFGATIELDQKVYTWTDKVYITIVAPDHNFDSGLVDEIGNTTSDPIKVSSRTSSLSTYKLVESGPDTGIFIGEVTLTGFAHDADGVEGNDTTPATSGTGPTDGLLKTTDNDGLTVSFEFSEDETVVGSALIRWSIGEVQWLESSYPASGTGVVRVIDADMNLNPEQIDNFAVDAWSDSDAGGIDLTVTETNEATGIFEGTVFFTVSNDSSGSRLRVSEGDTVTAEYEDNTLPDPYTTADELDISATTLIGTIVPPLERAPAANLRVVDAFGNSLNSVSVDQQVQISADLANGQDREQSFAYLVQVQDGNGVTVSLAWITGSLSSGQSFSPALSWIPTESGSYTATAFVWESVDNPTALSPSVSTAITVQ